MQKIIRRKQLMEEMLQALTPWFGAEDLYIDGYDICMSQNEKAIAGLYYDCEGWEINRGEYEWNQWETPFEPHEVFFDVWEWEHKIIIENIKTKGKNKQY